MMKLERNHNYQGLVFDDGLHKFVTGPHWEGDDENEELANEFREYFNYKFGKISEPLKIGHGIWVIRVHCSVDEFNEKYSELWDNAMAKEAYKELGPKGFTKFCIPTFVVGEDKEADAWLDSVLRRK